MEPFTFLYVKASSLTLNSYFQIFDYLDTGLVPLKVRQDQA
jgi:hypothetical protein